LGGNVKLIPRNCCKMKGIECTDSHVTEINWNSQGLSGTIPAELGNIMYLHEL
jgi:hypothetical protein